VHAVLGPLHAFVLFLPAISVPSQLPLKVVQAGAQCPQTPPGGGTFGVTSTLQAAQLATALRSVHVRHESDNGPDSIDLDILRGGASTSRSAKTASIAVAISARAHQL